MCFFSLFTVYIRMLTIIHGEDITKSRAFYLALKLKYPESIQMDGQDVDLTSLTQSLEGESFFTEEKNIFIENFFAKKKNTSDYKSLVEYLKKDHKSAKITLWEGKELEKSVTSLFNTASIRVFKHPQALFSLLDTIRPGNGEKLVRLFYETLDTTEVDAIFYMLIRHMRILIALQSIDSPTSISEVKRLQPWQSQKLIRQTGSFELKKLIKLYESLYQIESGYKTGSSLTPLSQLIDIFLLGI